MRLILSIVALASIVVSVRAVTAAPDANALPSILLSRQLAARAQVAAGDVVTLAADAAGTRARQFRVAGVYEPTPDPMRFTAERLEARMHLPDMFAIAPDPADAGAADAVGAINVRLADAADRRRFAADLRARMPGALVRSTVRSRDDDPFEVLDRFHTAISAITVTGGTAFLLALMVIRAEERRETIGILRLIGISRRTLLATVAVEGLLVATAGAVFGVLLALATEGLVNGFFQRRYDTALVFVHITPSIALRAVALAAPLGVLAGVAASLMLLRREVLSLFRR